MLGFVQGVFGTGLGHVVELLMIPLRHGLDYYLPFLKHGVDAACVLPFICQKS